MLPPMLPDSAPDPGVVEAYLLHRFVDVVDEHCGFHDRHEVLLVDL